MTPNKRCASCFKFGSFSVVVLASATLATAPSGVWASDPYRYHLDDAGLFSTQAGQAPLSTTGGRPALHTIMMGLGSEPGSLVSP